MKLGIIYLSLPNGYNHWTLSVGDYCNGYIVNIFLKPVAVTHIKFHWENDGRWKNTI